MVFQTVPTATVISFLIRNLIRLESYNSPDRKTATAPHTQFSPFANNASNILGNGSMFPGSPQTYPGAPPGGQNEYLELAGKAQTLGEIQTLKSRYVMVGGRDPVVMRNFENLENFFKTLGGRNLPNTIGADSDPAVRSALDQRDQEIARLRQEAEFLKMQNGQGSGSGSGSFTLGDMNLKLNGIDSNQKNTFNMYADRKEFFIQNEPRGVDLNSDEKLIAGISAQEADGLRQLSQLPIGTDLYRFKKEQLIDLSTTRAEMQKIAMEHQLLKMRRDFEKVRRDEDRLFENVRWVDEQRKNIIANRLRKDLNPPKQAQTYDPTEGFVIHWDYLLAVPKRHDSCQVVYGIYINGDEVYPPSMIEPHPCEIDTSVTNRCIFGKNHPISEIPANANALLIFEVQLFPSKDSNNPRLTNFGWSQLDLFDARRELK